LVQAPDNTQSFNRYSYVFNNPLSFTDPSGFAADQGYPCGGAAGCSNIESCPTGATCYSGDSLSGLDFSVAAGLAIPIFEGLVAAVQVALEVVSVVLAVADMMDNDSIEADSETDQQEDAKEENRQKQKDALNAKSGNSSSNFPGGPEDPNKKDENRADKQKKGTPGNNQAQNKQFKDATSGLDKAQKRKVHDEISGQNLSFDEIKQVADDVKNGYL